MQIIIKNFNFSFYTSLFSSTVIFTCSLFLLQYFLHEGADISYVFGDFPAKYGIQLLLNKYNAIVLCLFSFAFLTSILYSWQEMKELNKKSKVSLLFALQNLAFVGFVGMILTNDLFNLYVFLEIASLASYALIAVNFEEKELNSLKTSFDYLIIGSVAAVFYLIGVAFLYGFFGTLNIAQMSALLQQNHFDKSILIGALFILLGFTIKCGIFPFHMWLVNVYRNSMSSITLFLSAISSKTAIFVLIKYFLFVFNIDFFANLYPIIQIFSLVTIISGAIFALYNEDLIRMIAFSSVSQIGYILLAISFAFSSKVALSIAMLQFINHSCSKSLLFSLALQNNANSEEIIESKNISSKQNIYSIQDKISFSFFIIITFIALANLFGLPFLFGFGYKFLLISDIIDNQIILLLLLISSFLSFLYNKKIFITLYDKLSNWKKIHLSNFIVIIMILIIVILINLYYYNIDNLLY